MCPDLVLFKKMIICVPFDRRVGKEVDDAGKEQEPA